MNKQSGDILVEPVVNQYGNKNKSKQFANTIDYLDEYDEYYLDNEKYIQTGNGGKQRNKRDIMLNSRHDPSGNVRTITKNLQNFEHNRRKQ